jgi:tetratricopeptide (TPR) repeat protein
MEFKQWKLALNIFRKISSLHPDEPHSLRNLALVLIELGQYNQALEYFKQILTQTWDRRFNTIQAITLFDLNQMLNLMNKGLVEIDHRLIHYLSVDIRIIVQWDTPDTIIQLSVKEPTGEICHSSGLRHTKIGGYMTNTFFQADQPIEYLLRKAVQGKYSISVTFARNTQHTLTGVTTVLIYIYKYFGTNQKEQRIQTVRLTSLNQTIDIGEIEFPKSNPSSIQHLNITCDGCFQTPIIGDRYKYRFL